MICLSRRLLEQKSLEDGDLMDLVDALDLGIYTSLEFVIRVLQAGEGEAPVLVLQHAAVNETGAYLNFETPVSIDLTTTGSTWVHVAAFTRFVGWSLSGTLSSEAIVTIDVVAKG